MELIDPPDGRPWALIGIAGGSLLLNVVLAGALLWPDAAPTPADAPVADAPAAEATPTDDAASDDAVADATPPEDAEALVEEEAEGAPHTLPEGMRVASASVERNLAYTFHKAVGDGSDALSATTARLFVWDLDLRRDLQKGDSLAVAWTETDTFPQIEAAHFTSQKLGKTLTAYRFQASGDEYPSYWSAEGEEVPRRLLQTPLPGGYEQVTSLLKDRPTHAGMDFKVPVGAPVVTPRAGTVTRADWNWTNNGNCVEVRWADGTLARFLHLSDTQVKAGQRLSAGAVVGLSGNTGRSTAPHLHYELEKRGKTLDPIDVHDTKRRTLPDGDQERFVAEVARLDGILNGAPQL